MSNPPRPQKLTNAHLFCFAYITFSHLTDGEFSDSERNTILVKIAEWMPDETSASVSAKMDETIEWYNSLNNEERVNSMVGVFENMKENLPIEARRAVYNDVFQIANADGNVGENEAGWLNLMKDTLGV